MPEQTEYKSTYGHPLQLDIKQMSNDGEFEGYASVYGIVDQGDDIVKAGAFDESLRARPANKVKMLLQHDSGDIIGVWDQVSSDNKGLFVRGKLLLTVQDGQETYERMKVGALDSLSIGYRTHETEYDSDNMIRTIVRASLMEISVVTFPMNDQAQISGVKSFTPAIDGLANLSDAERLLREAGRSFSRKEAMDFVSVVRKIAQREAGAGHGEIDAINKLAELIRS